MSLFKKKGDKGQLAAIAQELKPEEAEDMCVEETLQLAAGYQETSAFCPGIDLQRLGGEEGEPVIQENDDDAIDEYS